MFRKCKLESLEERRLLSVQSDILSDYIDVSQLEVVPSYVSIDSPINHETTPGGIFDGVVQVNIGADQGNFLGSGVLLPTGQHVLTAAHNLTGTLPGTLLTNVTASVTFELIGGDINTQVVSATIASDWDGTLINGSDWAILELADEAPTEVPRHDIYRESNEIDAVGVKAGYGQGGQNIANLPSGTKRQGENRYELFRDNNQDILLFDFDNGLASNDTFGLLGLGADLGEGTDEVLNAPGDSGGPTFIDGKIAGITSFVTRAFDGTGDSDSTLNFSVGEIGGDTRVSAFASAIDAIIDESGVPAITDVRMSGSTWTGADPFSFAIISPTGNQLRPLYTQDIDTIEIEFSEHVLFGNDGSELSIIGLNDFVLDSDDYTFSYDVSNHVGTWEFNTPLANDKYQISLLPGTITDTGGNSLDTEFAEIQTLIGELGSIDDFTNDSGVAFPTGNGVSNGSSFSGLEPGNFNFYFSVLAGDVNQDGVIDSTDASSPIQDINGDGLANSADVAILSTLPNDSLPLRKNMGDYNDDDLVGIQDYQLWSLTFGSTSDLRADGNGDGVVNSPDYTIWRDNYPTPSNPIYTYSSWFVPPFGPIGGTASAPPLFLPGELPKVTNVTISGSNSVHAPYSFDSVDGTGDQLKTVPVGGADTVSITFNEDVNIQQDYLELIGLTTGTRPELVDFTYDIFTMTASWQFNNLLTADHYAIKLSDMVTDIEGYQLDGEWTNPLNLTTTNPAVSTFPSGDGYEGGDFVFVTTILPGDINLDNEINLLDLNAFVNYLGNPGGSPTDFQTGDFNGDGATNGLDLNTFSTNYGQILNQDLALLADLDGDLDVDENDRDILFSNSGMLNPTLSDGDIDLDGDIDIDDYDLLYEQIGLGITAVA